MRSPAQADVIVSARQLLAPYVLKSNFQDEKLYPYPMPLCYLNIIWLSGYKLHKQISLSGIPGAIILNVQFIFGRT